MTAAKTTNQWDTFGSFVQDANREKMSNFPNYFMTKDATGMPVTSPQSVNNVIALAVPVAAVTFTVIGSAALRVSEEATAAANYVVIPSNTPVTFPCARQPNIYLKGDAGAVATQFFFSNV